MSQQTYLFGVFVVMYCAFVAALCVISLVTIIIRHRREAKLRRAGWCDLVPWKHVATNGEIHNGAEAWRAVAGR